VKYVLLLHGYTTGVQLLDARSPWQFFCTLQVIALTWLQDFWVIHAPQDIIHPHTAIQTVETLKQVNFEVLGHPPYDPELSPWDYHLLGSEMLKEATISLVINKLRNLCLHGVPFSQKHFFLMAYRNLFIFGLSVLNSRKFV
jgi:hypothetical protein